MCGTNETEEIVSSAAGSIALLAILFAIFWFRNAITMYNGIGISLALFGAYCYMRAKQRGSKPSVPKGVGASPYSSPMSLRRAQQ